MKITLLVSALFLIQSLYAQSFSDESSVISYMDDKEFYNSENGLVIGYGYISDYNTYGIKVRNKNGAEFFFINVSIDAYGGYADLYGMSATDGSNFGFRLFKGKLVVGYGEPEASTYYLK